MHGGGVVTLARRRFAAFPVATPTTRSLRQMGAKRKALRSQKIIKQKSVFRKQHSAISSQGEGTNSKPQEVASIRRMIPATNRTTQIISGIEPRTAANDV